MGSVGGAMAVGTFQESPRLFLSFQEHFGSTDIYCTSSRRQKLVQCSHSVDTKQSTSKISALRELAVYDRKATGPPAFVIFLLAGITVCSGRPREDEIRSRWEGKLH